jgi:hypothetical protein
MVGLGFLPGDDASTPIAVSADGSVVVGNSQVFENPLAQARAFIWDAARGMRPLQDVLTADGLNLTGWVLAAAEGISADGNTIVGTGIHPNGLFEAWIATLVRTDVVIEVQPFIPKDPIVLNSRLPVPVVVFGSSTVDVTQIDATTLRFGPNGAAPLFSKIVTVGGQTDLLAFFEVPDTGLALGDTQACLQGQISGQPFRGCDDVVVIMFKGCGLGFELAPILPLLLWLRGRRLRKSE